MKASVALRVSFLFLWLTLVARCWPCFYSTYSFNTDKNSQTDLEDVLLDRYAEQEKAKGGTNYYAREVARLEKQLPTKRRDPSFLRDYGYLLHITGNTPQAVKIWEEALALAPNDYALLCNLATAYQLLGVENYPKARKLLEKAVQQKPGFRHHAEEFHLRLLDHLIAQSKDWQYIKRELLFPELTSEWLARKDPPNKFRADNLPPDAIEGLAELLRQFPRQADTWMVLGMLLESKGKWREARLAYQRALKFGCGMSDDLHAYFEKFRAFAEKKNPIRYVGWFFLSACLLMIAALIGPRVLATVKAVVEDIQEVRRRTKEQQSKPTARKGSSPRAKSD
jgi:Flp pilus assembly protein TadD